MSVLAEYRASLKSVAVEEPIDLLVHRPLAFVVAKLAYPTPLTPNQLTVLSMTLGVCSGAALLSGRPYAALLGAGLLFVSQVIDCSDGMLARMRKKGSELGRMLDGIADSITLFFAVAGTVRMMTEHAAPAQALGLLLLSLATVYTSTWHTSGYDHYKNLYLRATIPGNREGEDVEQAVTRWEAARAEGMGPVLRAVFPIYVNYLRTQRRLVAWFDPAAHVRLDALPPVTEASASAYARHMLPPLRIWRALFGVGSLVFGLSLFIALGRPEVFLAYRLIVLNAVFFGVLMPAQRKASQAAFRELGVTPIAQRGLPGGPDSMRSASLSR